MKVFKKLSMLFVAAAMMMTTVSTAFAAENDSKLTEGTGTINVQRDGATYKAYKVLGSKTKTVAGQTITVYNDETAFKNYFTTNGTFKFDADKGIYTEANGAINVVSNNKDSEKQENNTYVQTDAMKNLTSGLFNKVNENTPYETVKGNTPKTLTQGYYLIVEDTETITSTSNSGRVPSLAMLVEVKQNGTFEIVPKDVNIDINKSVLTEGNKDNVAGIGDVIPYTIKSTVPTYAANFKNIVYKVSDNMSKGLTLDENSIKITVNGVTVVENGVINDVTYFKNLKINDAKEKVLDITVNENGTQMAFDFNYDKLKDTAALGHDVVITYNAEINGNAVINSANTNDAKLDYTTNPDGETTGIEDHTDTYTYGIKLYKIDGATGNHPLANATFSVKNVEANKEFEQILKTDVNGYASLVGLGEGTYTITELDAPNGYVKLDGSLKIEIKASSDKKSATVKLIDADGEIASIIDSTQNGEIQLTVKNYKGINLPETGGMGTTIFMIGGAALIALAGVMLVVYSKKSKKA